MKIQEAAMNLKRITEKDAENFFSLCYLSV
jgi:hypothetical protein